MPKKTQPPEGPRAIEPGDPITDKVVVLDERATEMQDVAVLPPSSAPNIVWVGLNRPRVRQDDPHGVGEEQAEGDDDPWVPVEEPPSVVRLPDFPDGIEMPDAATQRAGFFLKQAGRVIQDVPGYKSPRRLGRKE